LTSWASRLSLPAAARVSSKLYTLTWGSLVSHVWLHFFGVQSVSRLRNVRLMPTVRTARAVRTVA
jgi:hypothetical protein